MAERPPEVSNEDLLHEIAALREDVRLLQRICGRMDEHISFVNSTYSAVRSPLSWVFTRINGMMGIGGGPSLPQIKDEGQ